MIVIDYLSIFIFFQAKTTCVYQIKAISTWPIFTLNINILTNTNTHKKIPKTFENVDVSIKYKQPFWERKRNLKLSYSQF